MPGLGKGWKLPQEQVIKSEEGTTPIYWKKDFYYLVSFMFKKKMSMISFIYYKIQITFTGELISSSL